MIIIQVAGGLGNQLQQYAMYEKLISLGRDAALDVTWYTDVERQQHVFAGRKLELRYFDNLTFREATPEEIRQEKGADDLFSKIARRLTKKKASFVESKMYHPELLTMTDGYLTGYFACEKYYADILPMLRKKIVFPPSTQPLNQEYSKRMKEECSISIHVRRGDYLDDHNAAMFGDICTPAYYGGAILEMKRRFENAHFYVFSDDVDYAADTYTGDEYTIVDWNKGEDSFFDIMLMSCCKHNICANSTFSFWGARLNDNPDKVMIRPSIHKNSQVYVAEEMHALWEGWLLIDKSGNIV